MFKARFEQEHLSRTLGKAHVPLFVLGALTLYVMIKAVMQSPNGVEGMASGMNMKKKEK